MIGLTTWHIATLFSLYALAREGKTLFHIFSITVSKSAFVPKGSSWHEAQKIRLDLKTLRQRWVNWTFADPCGKGRDATVNFSFLTRPRRPLCSSLTGGASVTFTVSVDGFAWNICIVSVHQFEGWTICTPPVRTLIFALEHPAAWTVALGSSASNSPLAYSRGSRSSSSMSLLLALALLMFRATNSGSEHRKPLMTTHSPLIVFACFFARLCFHPARRPEGVALFWCLSMSSSWLLYSSLKKSKKNLEKSVKDNIPRLTDWRRLLSLSSRSCSTNGCTCSSIDRWFITSRSYLMAKKTPCQCFLINLLGNNTKRELELELTFFFCLRLRAVSSSLSFSSSDSVWFERWVST